MTDTPEAPPPVDPPDGPRKVTIETPWYMKPALWVAIVCFSVTMMIFAFTSWQSYGEKKDENRDLRAAQMARDAVDARESELTRLESECRSGRSTALLVVTSQIAGSTADLFSTLARVQQTGGDPSTFQPILDRLEQLAREREVAETNSTNAVQECRQPR